ncbi:type II toxin-antitoxin system RelE/ParE family toxin [Sphingobium yanoikuyae]|uniref:Type II toxin-antitoxin system RelE/ParE family toxin n=1 Tax=Sphingobium yanoikuyae TaxID=13690 RepID=A0A291MYB9_SPHYA|nr:type II toxin-antitoxin system RelE/ParE family toxin [Sphingobium yanoikuyae]ATI79898.1 hypothetical protein A6768_07605 [Sphingobium yanoikuyae]
MHGLQPRLASRFSRFSDYPNSARLLQDILPPVRVPLYKAHLMIFDVGDDDEVTILRVWHGREDWMSSNYDG